MRAAALRFNISVADKGVGREPAPPDAPPPLPLTVLLAAVHTRESSEPAVPARPGQACESPWRWLKQKLLRQALHTTVFDEVSFSLQPVAVHRFFLVRSARVSGLQSVAQCASNWACTSSAPVKWIVFAHRGHTTACLSIVPARGQPCSRLCSKQNVPPHPPNSLLHLNGRKSRCRHKATWQCAPTVSWSMMPNVRERSVENFDREHSHKSEATLLYEED